MHRDVNPYMDLVENERDMILNCADGKPSPDELARLTAAKAAHSSICCELGSGSGAHLIELARRAPQRLHVGFEIRYKRIFRTAEKAKQAGVTNIILLRSDARQLPTLFGPASLDAVYVNFPDPWDKRRWEKHRILSQEFVNTILTLLKPNGFLSYKTDHANNFTKVHSSIANISGFSIRKFSSDLHRSEFGSDSVRTEFESLFISKGLPVHFLEAVRI